MQARGWHVVSIPYYQWSSLAGGDSQQAYLRDVLPAAALEACAASPQQPLARNASEAAVEEHAPAAASPVALEDAPELPESEADNDLNRTVLLSQQEQQSSAAEPDPAQAVPGASCNCRADQDHASADCA